MAAPRLVPWGAVATDGGGGLVYNIMVDVLLCVPVTALKTRGLQ